MRQQLKDIYERDKIQESVVLQRFKLDARIRRTFVSRLFRWKLSFILLYIPLMSIIILQASACKLMLFQLLAIISLELWFLDSYQRENDVLLNFLELICNVWHNTKYDYNTSYWMPELLINNVILYILSSRSERILPRLLCY